MVNRLCFDLSISRNNFLVPMKRWHYLFVGKCDGNVLIKLNRRSASELDPNEFDKLTGIEDIKKLYVTNPAQANGKVLNILFEEEEVFGGKIKVRGVS